MTDTMYYAMLFDLGYELMLKAFPDEVKEHEQRRTEWQRNGGRTTGYSYVVTK